MLDAKFVTDGTLTNRTTWVLYWIRTHDYGRLDCNINILGHGMLKCWGILTLPFWETKHFNTGFCDVVILAHKNWNTKN